MNLLFLITFSFIICCSANPSPQSSSVDARHYRPVNEERGRGHGGRGGHRGGGGRGGGYYPPPDKDGYLPDPTPVDDGYKGNKDADKTRPAIPGRDDWPNPSTGGRPGVGSDYNPNPVPGGGGGGGGGGGYGVDDYEVKPVGSGKDDVKPDSGGGYDPNPYPGGGKDDSGDDFNPNPYPGGGKDDSGGDYNPDPYPGGGKDDSGGDFNPNPSGGKDDSGGDYNPDPYPGGGKDDSDGTSTGTGDKGGSRPDLGGYDNPKDDDYNDYKPADKVKDEDFGDDYKSGGGGGGGNCICVPYYQCQEGHIVTDGSGIIDARKRPDTDGELPLDGKFKPPSCGPFHVCCDTPETSTVKPYEHRCGVRNPSGINSRILSPSNKGESDFGEWPWQAAVLKVEGTVNIFQCGGVIIDKFHVLTVAHCVFHLSKANSYPLKVRLGEWDTQTTSEFLAHEDYKVSKITIHPEYRNNSLWNDIAILKLQDPVLFAPHIDTVCLPKHDENFAGQNCVVTGWGKDAYKGGTFSNIMKEVALQVVDNYKCEEMLRKTRLGRFFQLHDGFACAGGEHGLDSCKGDGGGPLVCYRKDRSYALAGLVSWGIDCGQPGVPGVYVKIQKYLEWISKNTGVPLQEYWPKPFAG